MTDANLAGRCGIYCGACLIHRAYKDSNKEIQEEMAGRVKPSRMPKDVVCEGCQTLLTSQKSWAGEEAFPLVGGRNCKIILCLETKGLDFCCECTEYPDCEMFSSFGKIC